MAPHLKIAFAMLGAAMVCPLNSQPPPPPIPPNTISRPEPFPNGRKQSPDLSNIGHITSKGRVQDREYNPDLFVVDQLIQVGPKSLQFLVSKLNDHTIIERGPGEIIDFCGFVTVSEIAFRILNDFLTTADWLGSTIPGGLRDIIDTNGSASFHDDFHAHIKNHGPESIKGKVLDRMKTYNWNFTWDSKEKCFRPA